MLSLPPLASVALDNGVARTPPMGWMTWERFRCTADGGDVAGGGASQPSCAEDPENGISERLVRQHAEIMARPEWRGAGYEYLNIDDCWENWSRSPGGKLAPNSTRFPHGMRALADYVHSLGLKLGTYNDMGTETCGGYPGECKDESCSLPGYMGVDAATYAGWGIDSLKMDGCHSVHTHGVLDPASELPTREERLGADALPLFRTMCSPFQSNSGRWLRSTTKPLRNEYPNTSHDDHGCTDRSLSLQFNPIPHRGGGTGRICPNPDRWNRKAHPGSRGVH